MSETNSDSTQELLIAAGLIVFVIIISVYNYVTSQPLSKNINDGISILLCYIGLAEFAFLLYCYGKKTQDIDSFLTRKWLLWTLLITSITLSLFIKRCAAV